MFARNLLCTSISPLIFFRPSTANVFRVVLLVAIGVVSGRTSALAAMEDPLAKRLSPQIARELVPLLDGLQILEGEMPVAIVERDGNNVAYIFSTHEAVSPAGYSGQSFDVMVALRVDGTILGHLILEHREPLIGTHQVTIGDVDQFLGQLHGLNVAVERRAPFRHMDGVSGATISANAMWDAVMGSAVVVGYMMGIISDEVGGLSIERFSFSARTWDELISDSSIKIHRLTNGLVREAFIEAGVYPELDGEDEEDFLTLYIALATPPSVGRNLFGPKVFRKISQGAMPGEHHLLIASTGGYSWVPRNPYLVDIFDRVKLVQGNLILALETKNFYPARRYAAQGSPKLSQGGRFLIPAEAGFDPTQEWALQFTLIAGKGEGDPAKQVGMSLPYRIPPHHVVGSEEALENAGLKEISYIGIGKWRRSMLSDWQIAWASKQWEILGLLSLLALVTLVLCFHQYLTRHRQIYRFLRCTILLVTLIWLGWIVGAQLTILSVINYFRLFFSGTSWASVLFDPLLIILSGYVAITLVIWGRGVFCGWLCPFGALQELLAQLGRLLSIPRMMVPKPLQKRGHLVKYFAAGGIIILTIFSAEWAALSAEVEPFKTAISLHFGRSWPYVLYALALLSIGLFIERFFCRYLCPLGALLAVGGRFHFFNTLLRRFECGNPCHLCERSCPIGAIEPDGEINMHECHQCLDCQIEYHDPARCPALSLTSKPSDY